MTMNMYKRLIILTIGLLASMSILAEDVQNVKPVKNVIVLIPDGCSISTVSTARWYQWITNPEKEHLALDPYICGSVRTSCSDAPIGDSAPTTSCYMTGYMTRSGWVSTYPPSNQQNDIYPTDPNRTYQPLTTILEAAKQLFGKSTGLVCTCEFPHATPADCSAHSYDRGAYQWIMPQQAHNEVNVLIGGGAGILPKDCQNYLEGNGWGVFKDDINAMRTYSGDNMWALFAYKDVPYEIDRDAEKYPSIAEMTSIAIEKLSHNKKGFFLMVEGSKVDWAAHDNDLPGMIHDYIAFDEACRVAFEFAKKDGNTAVIVVPDHSNSGISIGRRDLGSYSTMSKDQIFGALTKLKASAAKVAGIVNSTPFDQVQNVFKEWCGFELKDNELEVLKNNGEYRQSPIPREQRKYTPGPFYNTGLTRTICQFMSARTGIGFTTNGHTGEEVFLAAYHPQRDSRPYGMLTNVELNHYLCSLFGITHDDLDKLTDKNFAPHTEVFKGMSFETKDVTVADKTTKQLIVKGTNNELAITPFCNYVEVATMKGNIRNVEIVKLPSVTVYVDKNKTFYLPRSVKDLLK